MKKLDAAEYPLGKVFSSDFEFSIPDYQRPYSWGAEQALQLLDDLEGALGRHPDESYFLGSIVLVRDGERRAEVIDGQQRLTTLSILFATMRDLTTSPELSTELRDFVLEPGKITAGTKPKPRLTLRARDAKFFHDFVQRPGQMDRLTALDDNTLGNDAQRAIRDNAVALRDRLLEWSEDKRQDLAAMTGTRTFLVVVSTRDLVSAHRIFSVMNARGLDLSPADVFKAQVIGAIDNDEQADYAKKWEDAEEDLGREGFAELFLHIRMVFAKERARRELLLEFPEQVLNPFLDNKRAAEFVDDVLLPYAEAYEHLVNQDYDGGAAWQRVNAWLGRLVRLDNNDWRPPALWALKHHGGDPVYLDSFLRRLERVAASMLLLRVYATPRATRYANLLKELESGEGLNANGFMLTDEDRADTRDRLGGELYLVGPVRNYVLLRLDELLASQPGVTYEHKLITVEHVLPQNPKSDSQWCADFTEDERAHWTHRLANLVLLNRRKNSSAQRYDFQEKKVKYFTGANGVATFALTTGVLGHDSWTPAVLTARQADLTNRLFNEWELN